VNGSKNNGGMGIGLVMMVGLIACSQEAPPPPPVEDKCPAVGMDVMAGQWIKVDGQKADHTHRFELVSTAAEGEEINYDMWYVGGSFTKKRMTGVRKTNDFQFTEVPSAAKKEAYERGEQTLTRLYVQPKKQKCSLRVSVMEVSMTDKGEKVVAKPGFVEYLTFPEGQELTFRPCDEPLFFGGAAKDHGVAEGQIASLGGSDPVHSFGEAIPVAAWSETAADGDDACSYDMDLYFDDRPVEGKQALAAGEAKDGIRQWLISEWYAPYSGNHHFEVYRYRTCTDGARSLIAVSCVDAVLQ